MGFADIIHNPIKMAGRTLKVFLAIMIEYF